MATKRDDISIKADRKVVEVAHKAAALCGKSLAEYVTDVLREAAERDLHAEAEKIVRGPKPKR